MARFRRRWAPTGATSAARQLLGLGDGTIHAGFESLFQQRFATPLRMLDVDASFRLRTPQGFEFAARLVRAGTAMPSALRQRGPLGDASARRPREQAQVGTTPEAPQTLRQLTSRHAHAALEHEGGNKLRAARRLGISRSTLYRLLSSADDAH